jgi:large subunit ribosomal protein L29
MGANKKMQTKDIAALSDKDLIARIKADKVAVGKMEFSHAVSSSENPMNIRTKRRDIARMFTHLNSRAKVTA